MDKFDLKIKKSKLQVRAKDDFSDSVMSKIDNFGLSIWTGRLLVGFLIISIGFLMLNIFSSNELRSLIGMLVNDFDIISTYPGEFITGITANFPWFNLVFTLGVSLIAIWYFRRLKSYAS